MCLLVVCWQSHPRYRLAVAANRDEFHDRACTALAPWRDAPHLIAGCDLRAGGTWLGIDRKRRFGTVTNFREMQRPRRAAPSRGRLVPDFLGGERTPHAYLAELETDAPGYSGFNLLLATADELWYASNRSDAFAHRLPPGVHGLSNELLDAPWPKLLRVRQRFEARLSQGGEIAAGELFTMLADREPAGGDAELPSTGLSLEWERQLSAPFVVNERYGTRCSTVLLLEHSGALLMAERTFDAQGNLTGETEYSLNAADWPAAAP
ncbi:MAG TPA: NRDE family protein [Steroidobacteraceae bacterium]|nr:NRDE family protein [Steroidobacteraceae bacterium]